jgi:hypothetical protein
MPIFRPSSSGADTIGGMPNRSDVRRPFEMLFNKYLEGYPYLCRTVDLSSTGLRAELFSQPAHGDETFPVELRLPYEDESLWIWARRVWQRDQQEALFFMSMRDRDRTRLKEFLQPSGARLIPLFPEDLLDA